ncbi:hypothetical protein L1887_47150 [Cichorium endivia]|nr:hypothetical protein L1887_47150 [Cichorium endivia]
MRSAISCLIDESPYEDEDQNCSSTRAVVLGLRKKTLTHVGQDRSGHQRAEVEEPLAWRHVGRMAGSRVEHQLVRLRGSVREAFAELFNVLEEELVQHPLIALVDAVHGRMNAEAQRLIRSVEAIGVGASVRDLIEERRHLPNVALQKVVEAGHEGLLVAREEVVAGEGDEDLADQHEATTEVLARSGEVDVDHVGRDHGRTDESQEHEATDTPDSARQGSACPRRCGCGGKARAAQRERDAPRSRWRR